MLPDSFRVPADGTRFDPRFARGARAARSRACGCSRELEDLRFAGATEPFTRIAGDIRVQRDDSTISVEATDLELSRPGAPWRHGEPRGAAHAQGRAHRHGRRCAPITVRIENLAALAAALPAGRLRDRIATLAPRGELRGIDLTVTDVGERRVPDITGRLRFSDIGFGPLGRAAGITGFDGTLEGRGGGGIVKLATRDATIDWPQQLRAPIPVLRGDGRVRVAAFRHRRPALARRRLWRQRPRQRARQVAHGAASRGAAAARSQRDRDGFRRDATLALPADGPAVAEGDPLARRRVPRPAA